MLRRTNILLASVIAAFAAVLGAPALAAAAAPASIDPVEIQQVKLINHFRAKQGLKPLRIDGTLTKAAEYLAADMGNHATFSHDDTSGRDPFRRIRDFGYPSGNTWRGENIAAGNEDAKSTYLQWLNSPPHKANWMQGKYRAVGIARVYVAGSPYGWYWVTDFGSSWTSRPA